MAPTHRRLALAGALLLAAVIGRAEGPPAGDDKMPREPDATPAADEAKTAPSVTLTKKEYDDLLEKIARLEGSGKVETPSTCRVGGRVAGDVAHLHVEFEFRTDARRARVALGCTQAYPTEAKIDNHPAAPRLGPDGLTVQVDDVGDHRVVLELDLPVAPRERGADRGFDLDLPAAAVTTLDLELPPGVKKAQGRMTERQSGGRPPRFEIESPPNGPSRLKAAGGLAAERLEVTWEGQAVDAGPATARVESSRIVVSVDEKNVATHAEITVRDRRGQLKELQILVPPQADVQGPQQADREVRIDPSQGARRTVHFKPSTDPLTLTIDVAQPRAAASVPVGPFVVVGASPQGGDILVTAPADTTLDPQPRAASQYWVTPREPTAAEKGSSPTVLALRYNTKPGAEKAAPSPFLELDVRRLSNVLWAGATHTLRLVRGAADAPAVWRITTTINAQASNSEIDHLSIDLPLDYTLDPDVGAQVQAATGDTKPTDVGVEQSAGSRRVGMRLAAKRKLFKLTFDGLYPLPPRVGDVGDMTIPLPQLADRKSDRGAVVSVELPRGLEFVPPRAGPSWDVDKPDGNKAKWTTDRWPAGVEVAWRPHRPELIVNGDVRITLQGRQASVSHRLWPAPGQAAPEQLPLSVPGEVIGLTVVGDKDKEAPPRRDGKDGTPTVPLPQPTDRDHPLILRYAFRLPEQAADRVKVPLVWPRTATGGETRVCVWSDPGTRPEWNNGPWEVRRTEEVKDEDKYPSLVLRTRQAGAPLTLALGEAAGMSLPAFRVERALMQVTVAESGQQTYRARFRLGQVAAPTIDVILPQPLFRPNPNPADLKGVFIAGKAAAWRPVDEAGKEVAVSATARVQVPADATGKSVVLEINYTLLPSRSVLQTELRPPQLRGDPGAAPVRWQVALPPSWVPLSPDALGPEYGWGRRGWLFALRPTVATADFERWFADPDAAPPDGNGFPDPSVAAWRSSPEPLRLSHVPEQPWLLVCSLTLLIVGLSLTFVALPRAVFWGTLAVLAVGALLTGLFWPGVLGAVLYGCQPGALVLLPVLGLHWLLQQRYRRQVVFLPGFTRLKAGSSLVRGSSRPRGEPSTVDAVPPAAADSGGKKPQADGAA